MIGCAHKGCDRFGSISELGNWYCALHNPRETYPEVHAKNEMLAHQRGKAEGFAEAREMAAQVAMRDGEKSARLLERTNKIRKSPLSVLVNNGPDFTDVVIAQVAKDTAFSIENDIRALQPRALEGKE